MTKKGKGNDKKNEKAKDFSDYTAWMVEIHISNGVYGAFFEELVYLPA